MSRSGEESEYAPGSRQMTVGVGAHSVVVQNALQRRVAGEFAGRDGDRAAAGALAAGGHSTRQGLIAEGKVTIASLA